MGSAQCSSARETVYGGEAPQSVHQAADASMENLSFWQHYFHSVTASTRRQHGDHLVILLLKTLLAVSNVQPVLVILLTVRLYVPRPPVVLNLAMPVELVVAVCVTVAPPGLAHIAETTAPETVVPLASLTTTVPVTLTFFPCSAADKLIEVLHNKVLPAGLTIMVTVSLRLTLLLSQTVNVAGYVPA